MTPHRPRVSTLLLAIALLLASPANAGSMSVAWDPVSDADLAGYRVYWGLASGAYTQQQDVGGSVSSLSLGGLTDCATHYVAVKARDAAGNVSASFSNEIVGLPRPIVAQLQPAAVEQGGTATVVIAGANFAPGATVQFGNAGITVGSVAVNSCTQITVSVTVAATAVAGAVAVDVTNADRVFGSSTGLFAIQAGAPPTVASTSPASLATSVPVTVQPTVRFSKAMSAATILMSTVRLIDATGAAVAQAAGSPSLSVDGRTATIVPAARLGNSKSYRVQVVGGASGARDLSGVAMAATFTQSSGFTTVADTAGPEISAVTPTAVSGTTATVTWTTDEPSSSQLFYRKAGAASYQATPVDPTLVTSHSVSIQGLAPSSTYAFYVQSADAAGNSTSSSPDGSFATGASGYTYLTFEAESGVLSVPVRASTGSGAFRGAWISTASGTPTGTATLPSGRADYSFHVPSDGTWYVWIRLFGSSTASDAWFESVDGALRQSIAPSTIGAWKWTAARSYPLTQGLHTLEIAGREAQARADRVVITDDPTFQPTEQPDTDTTAPPQAVGVTATPSDRAIELAWTNPSADVGSVIVRFRTDGRHPQHSADGFPLASRPAAAGNAERVRHDGLANGTTYRYGVFIVDGSGNASAPAQVVSTPTDATPPAAVGNAWRTDTR